MHRTKTTWRRRKELRRAIVKKEMRRNMKRHVEMDQVFLILGGVERTKSCVRTWTTRGKKEPSEVNHKLDGYRKKGRKERKVERHV